MLFFIWNTLIYNSVPTSHQSLKIPPNPTPTFLRPHFCEIQFLLILLCGQQEMEMYHREEEGSLTPEPWFHPRPSQPLWEDEIHQFYLRKLIKGASGAPGLHQ